MIQLDLQGNLADVRGAVAATAYRVAQECLTNSLRHSAAREIVLRDRKASTSYIQRRLSIGYNRAADLIERMEREGLISAPNQTGRREILAGDGSAHAASA